MARPDADFPLNALGSGPASTDGTRAPIRNAAPDQTGANCCYCDRIFGRYRMGRSTAGKHCYSPSPWKRLGGCSASLRKLFVARDALYWSSRQIGGTCPAHTDTEWTQTVIDPVHSLSFSMQSSPGVYAVLLGSGISRAAKIPTGWEITLDLVRRLATISREDCGSDPERWYLTKFGNAPNYSDILNEVAKTAMERQQLLRSYWEPTDEERQEGYKQPTKAHQSLASLARRGFVRVIVTTNFDRLMELALREEGVEPTVLSTVDQINGALPLVHTQCCVFKVHGDYLDPRIRNTRDELASYPEVIDGLLDRIFDEFGLIVCGWSAEWDGALRSALMRAQSRRFTTYWASRGDPGEAAQRLINHRKAHLVPIDGADAFFEAVQAQVEAIDEFSQPHPLSTEAAVVSLKRYMSENRYRIQLADLVDAEVRRVTDSVTGAAFAAHGGAKPDEQSVTARVRGYEAACSTLMAYGECWRVLGRTGALCGMEAGAGCPVPERTETSRHPVAGYAEVSGDTASLFSRTWGSGGRTLGIARLYFRNSFRTTVR